MEYIKLSYHHLNFEDRTALMLESRKEGFSARKFAELIKRHPSTIYRELKRNSINDVYQAQYASDNTFARRRRGHRKLKIDSILWKFIVEAIRCLWSPQQIAKRLKTFPDLDQTMNVSHTTIYSTIRALPKGELKKDLLSCLRHENKKRKANGEPKKDSILQDIKTIHERPAEVQERKIPGHWEADLIKGKDNKSSIATLIERNTRLCILATLPDAKAESVRKALTEALKYLPAELHFCDPHSPWQKGTCENMNGLIRQYLPKGIDLNQADQHYLNQVAMSLNTRPRKALDWLTPLEKFAQLVDYHMAFETVAPHV
ncbi:IS30 family transposase [Acinetobacter baumannii]|uniref:IS30 family transposase n=1 Tax=Acinetobacter baumannii TaxID=470 RepID=UPI003CC7A4EB